MSLTLFTLNSCKKDLITAGIKSPVNVQADSSTKMVYVPGGGMMFAKDVHMIEPGYYL
jgi:hypothetical protein